MQHDSVLHHEFFHNYSSLFGKTRLIYQTFLWIDKFLQCPYTILLIFRDWTVVNFMKFLLLFQKIEVPLHNVNTYFLFFPSMHKIRQFIYDYGWNIVNWLWGILKITYVHPHIGLNERWFLQFLLSMAIFTGRPGYYHKQFLKHILHSV